MEPRRGLDHDWDDLDIPQIQELMHIAGGSSREPCFSRCGVDAALLPTDLSIVSTLYRVVFRRNQPRHSDT